MKNQKFVLHKALLDAYYTLLLKRQKLENSISKLDINPDIEACWKYYKEVYRPQYKSLEEAFLSLKTTADVYKSGVKKRAIKGSKEEKAHGLFQIYFCDYTIIHEGIESICEELGVPYSKVKDKLYRVAQLYHTLKAEEMANPENAKIPIHPFMEGMLRQKWFHDAFSLNARNILENVIKNNIDNIIEDRYILNRQIW